MKATPRRWRLGGEYRTNHDQAREKAACLGEELILSDWKEDRCDQEWLRHSVHLPSQGKKAIRRRVSDRTSFQTVDI